MRTIIVTGSAGLIGSAVADFFLNRPDGERWQVCGVDNNMRAQFFGAGGDTTLSRDRLKQLDDYRHFDLDIRDREGVLNLIDRLKPDAIVHAAAQPSHDKAADIPFDDFDVNAVGTLNLLEATRRHAPKSTFVHMSTNKVYGDGPNHLDLVELDTRWEYADPKWQSGIAEDFPIDHTMHSLFGASKVASDVMVQEYGRYFGMSTCCLRGGCLTGPNHAGVELHGFLSYLAKCAVTGKSYTIFGYKGKQVRDNVHGHDVARFINEFIRAPRSGEVYNMGGGKGNSVSMLEAIAKMEEASGNTMNYTMSDQARMGDHIVYYSDLSRLKKHYPSWDISIGIDQIIAEIIEAWQQRSRP